MIKNIIRYIATAKKRLKHEINCYNKLKKTNKKTSNMCLNNEKDKQANSVFYNEEDPCVGDIVQLSDYARAKYIRGKNTYGCCNKSGDCLCEKMFENNVMGIVTKTDYPMIEVFWSNSVKGFVLADNVTLIKEKI